MPIDIASDAEILSLYFEITYCSQDIEFSNLEFNSVSGECFADFEEDKENLKISIASTHPWNGKDNRIGLKFKKKDSDSKRKTTIKLSRVSLNENLVKINIMDSESSLEPSKPDHLTLSQNYPNPFNSFTSISYQIPKSCHVTLQIYNTLGQLINTLLDSDHETGTYHVQWDGKSNQNRDVPSGVYFNCLKTSNEKVIARINQKMILIR